MKLLITITFFLGIPGFAALAQVPDWIWARSGGGNANDGGFAVAADPSGNVYVAGTFTSDSVAFGSIKLYTSFLMKPALFLVKYDFNGNVIWARNATGKIGYNISLAADPGGNIYVAGSFESASILFDSIMLTRDSTGSDIFIAKYDSSGNILWANRTGGKSIDQANCITTDASGNVYIGGNFQLSFVFASDTLTCISAYSDLFFAKYNSTGTELWAKSTGGIYNEQVNAIKTDVPGNIYLAGQFQSPQVILGNDTLVNAGPYWDSFLSKCDTSGNVIWAKNPGSVEDDMAMAVAADNSGNIYIAGSFRGPSINFGTINLVNTQTLNYDTYTAKYDSNGIVQWAQNAGGSSHDLCNSMCLDSNNNVFITGFFESLSINFGSITLTRPGPNGQEVFLASYDSNGNILWAKKGTGAGYDRANAVTSDHSSNIYTAGYFGGFSILFGSQYITSSANGNHTEIFLAKLGNPVGLNEMDDKGIVSLYPNPSNGNFTFELPPDVLHIQIIDAMGRVISNINGSKNHKFSYEISDSGIYYIRATTSKEIIMQRIAVCR